MDSQEIINLHSYYDENNQLKSQLIKYELTNEELQTVIENQSFDGFWDRIYFVSLDSLNNNASSAKMSKSAKDPDCFCTIVRIPWTSFNRPTGNYGSNYQSSGGYSSGPGGSGGQTPISVIPIELQKLWGIAHYTSYYQGSNYVGPDCNCRNSSNIYTNPVRWFSISDLKIPNNPNSPNAYTNFSYYHGYYYYYGINGIIKDYYETAYSQHIGPYKTTKITLQDHLNKQSFVNSFFTKFLYPLESQKPATHEYLRKNSQLLKSVFNFLSKNNESASDFYTVKIYVTDAIETYIRGVEIDNGISDFVDEEPVKSFMGTVTDFKDLLDNSPRGVGKFKGNEASNYLKSLGETKFNFKQMRPLPTQTGFFNTKKGRYIYTKKGGWIDMAHFMFYAGKAYEYKLDGKSNPIGEAVQDGYKQEFSDSVVAKHSAYSYEDLPSDKFGAEFAVNYFNPNNNLTFGEQLANYLNNILQASQPNSAPNYDNTPEQDSKNHPTNTNRTTIPIFTQ